DNRLSLLSIFIKGFLPTKLSKFVRSTSSSLFIIVIELLSIFFNEIEISL
ncbi:hypothetical protein HMPREF9972_03950, partial [Staphylococcus epidermidis NIH04008]